MPTRSEGGRVGVIFILPSTPTPTLPLSRGGSAPPMPRARKKSCGLSRVAKQSPVAARPLRSAACGRGNRRRYSAIASARAYHSSGGVMSTSRSPVVRLCNSLFGISRAAVAAWRLPWVRSSPGMTQVGIVIERRSASVVPISGRSPLAANGSRHACIMAMNSFGSMAISRSRLPGRSRMRSAKCSSCADRRHPALLGEPDVLVVVLLREPLDGELAAGDAPQDQRPHDPADSAAPEQREPRARRAAADDRRHHAELLEQRMQVVGPDFVFRLAAVEGHIGGAAIAPVVNQHAVALRGHPLGDTASRCDRDCGRPATAPSRGRDRPGFHS